MIALEFKILDLVKKIRLTGATSVHLPKSVFINPLQISHTSSINISLIPLPNKALFALAHWPFFLFEQTELSNQTMRLVQKPRRMFLQVQQS